MSEKNTYISLKEAAQISGYSPDYVGQLIRKGKLPGKQVFSNVAWMTTEDAIREYLDKDKKKSSVHRSSFGGVWECLFSLEGLAVAYTVIAWMVIVLLSVFLLFLAYVFAASVDTTIERSIGSNRETTL